MNLNGTGGYRAGEGCYRPGRTSEPTSGTIGGYVYLRNPSTAPYTLDTFSQATMDFAMTFFWVYSTLSNAAPMCGMNNGQWCITAAANPWMWLSATGTSYPNGKVDSDDGHELYQGNNVTLISWDPRYKPVGYYTYQNVTTREGCDGRCEHTCGETDPSFYPWRNTMVNGAYNHQSTAAYCDVQDNRNTNQPGRTRLTFPNYSLNARIDFLFQKLGKFTVSGHVYKDENRDGIKQTEETTPVPNATVTLTGVGSTQTNPTGYYSFSDVLEGTYTISAQADRFYPTNPVNGTTPITFTEDKTQDFLMKQMYRIGGTVRKADNNGDCTNTSPGFPNVRLQLVGPGTNQSFTTTGSGEYQFINLDGTSSISYALSVSSQNSNRIIPASPIFIPSGSDSLNNDFCAAVSRPWMQIKGDVHSNTRINLQPAPR